MWKRIIAWFNRPLFVKDREVAAAKPLNIQLHLPFD